MQRANIASVHGMHRSRLGGRSQMMPLLDKCIENVAKFQPSQTWAQHDHSLNRTQTQYLHAALGMNSKGMDLRA